MLWTVLVILLILWLVGWRLNFGGGVIHTLLVVIVIILILKLLGVIN